MGKISYTKTFDRAWIEWTAEWIDTNRTKQVLYVCTNRAGEGMWDEPAGRQTAGTCQFHLTDAGWRRTARKIRAAIEHPWYDDETVHCIDGICF